ncbi:TonB-dependent receptor [Sphingomonas profundi]|uniref:TonB-dependent receptor n=1 Tax=Alterirhizorhabdus profundi TaxID=2681549 RepID=UPI0012E90334|nr:TonB-dependent receptor [Sphingomonas profundi]
MAITRRPTLLLALGGVALAGLTAPALAQDAGTAPSTQAEIGTPAPADAAAQGSPAQTQAENATADDSQIQDIVVSARRRDETLQQTPIAITAIAPAQLEAKATINIGDLQGSAPNVLITSQNTGGAASNVSIRGLSFADVDKSFESTVGIVVDGVFIGTSTGSYLDFFDIASIEVLRGPQGTLFGRNTIGGVINIRRTRPTGEFGGKFELSYGNYDSFQARAVVNAPIVKDLLAVKGFYFHNQSDGYYRSGITGKRRGASNNENFGLSFLFTPSSNYDALVTLEKQVQDFDPVNSSITKTGEAFCTQAIIDAFAGGPNRVQGPPANECNRNTSGRDLYTVFGSAGSGKFRAPAATLEQNLDLDFTKLTSITGYRRIKERQMQDVDALSADLYYFDRKQRFWQFTQELRAAGKFTDTFDYVIGGFYYQHRYSLAQTTRFFGFTDPNADQLTIGKSQSYAAFGDFNWAFADRFRLSFGGRYTHDKKQNELTIGQGASFGNFKYSGSKFTPKVGVDYRPTDDLMVYASWSRGYRSGGFSGRGLTPQSSRTPYGPETVDSYEIGLKTSFFDRKLLFNIAGFYADYKDLQQNTTVPTSGNVGNETIVTNVGSARLKGIEMDFTAKPVEHLTFSGSLGYLQNGFRNFISQGSVSPLQPAVRTIDYSNVDMIYAPKITASLNAEYAQPLDFGKWTTNVGYRFISRYDQQVALDATATYPATGTLVIPRNDPRVRSDRQNLLDASTSLTFDLGGNEARVTGFVRNLLDDRGPNAAFTVAGLWSFSSGREPRTYGVQLGYKF